MYVVGDDKGEMEKFNMSMRGAQDDSEIRKIAKNTAQHVVDCREEEMFPVRLKDR